MIRQIRDKQNYSYTPVYMRQHMLFAVHTLHKDLRNSWRITNKFVDP